MNREKQIENERYDIARIMAENFHINGEGWDDSDFEWAAHCVQMAGYRKQSEPISCGHEKGGEWISVDERLPEKDGRYLVAMKNGDNYHISTRKFKRADPPHWWKGVIYGRWARYTGGVRYWMPLPEAPKMKGGAE